ncbi:MAG: cell division septal protein FtsQ [Candidatus Deianiraeaceae bacterium]|jgi:cell division septal protein FtsQ
MNPLKYFVWFVGILCVAVCIVFFLSTRTYSIHNKYTNFFSSIYRKIDYVEIVGNKLISTNTITNALYDLTSEDKFLLKKKGDIVRSLKQIPLINEVRLKYTLPSKLLITIIERKPLMFYHGKYHNIVIIDTKFNEFSDDTVDVVSLIYIRGEYKKDKIHDFFMLLHKFPLLYENLTEIEDFYGYRYNIVLNNKLQILLPENSPEKSLQKLQEYIIRYNLLKTAVYRIDFRHPNKVFLGIDKNKTVYRPEKNKYIIYKDHTRNDKYRKIIENAISKI